MSVYAAAVSFWAMVSLVPLLAMVVFGVAIFGEPAAVESFLEELSATIPGETVDVLTSQIRGWVEVSTEISTVGLIIAVFAAGWGASSGVSHLLRAINVAHGLAPRTYVRRRIFALWRTLAALLFVIPIVALVTATPAALSSFGAPGWLRWTIAVVRWPVVAALFFTLLGALYWAAPTIRRPFRVLTLGVGIAAVLFLALSAMFSVYVGGIDKYDSDYGSLGTVVVTMLWVYLTTSVILLGAEVDAIKSAVWFAAAPEKSVPLVQAGGPQRNDGDAQRYKPEPVAGASRHDVDRRGPD